MLLLALLLTQTAPELVCVVKNATVNSNAICASTGLRSKDRIGLRGPGIACGRYFALRLEREDRLRRDKRVSGAMQTVIETRSGTIRFGDEDLISDYQLNGRMPIGWMPGLYRLRSSASEDVGMPYHLVDTSGRFILPNIDGTALRGQANDRAVLDRITTRRADTRCTWTIDLGNIGFMDEAVAPTSGQPKQ